MCLASKEDLAAHEERVRLSGGGSIGGSSGGGEAVDTVPERLESPGAERRSSVRVSRSSSGHRRMSGTTEVLKQVRQRGRGRGRSRGRSLDPGRM